MSGGTEELPARAERGALRAFPPSWRATVACTGCDRQRAEVVRFDADLGAWFPVCLRCGLWIARARS